MDRRLESIETRPNRALWAERTRSLARRPKRLDRSQVRQIRAALSDRRRSTHEVKTQVRSQLADHFVSKVAGDPAPMGYSGPLLETENYRRIIDPPFSPTESRTSRQKALCPRSTFATLVPPQVARGLEAQDLMYRGSFLQHRTKAKQLAQVASAKQKTKPPLFQPPPQSLSQSQLGATQGERSPRFQMTTHRAVQSKQEQYQKLIHGADAPGGKQDDDDDFDDTVVEQNGVNAVGVVYPMDRYVVDRHLDELHHGPRSLSSAAPPPSVASGLAYHQDRNQFSLMTKFAREDPLSSGVPVPAALVKHASAASARPSTSPGRAGGTLAEPWAHRSTNKARAQVPVSPVPPSPYERFEARMNALVRSPRASAPRPVTAGGGWANASFSSSARPQTVGGLQGGRSIRTSGRSKANVAPQIARLLVGATMQPSIALPFRLKPPAYMDVPRRCKKLSSWQSVSNDDATGGANAEHKHKTGGANRVRSATARGAMGRLTANASVSDLVFRVDACRRAGRYRALANALYALGVLYDNSERYTEAVGVYEQFLRVIQTKCPQDSASLSLAWNSLGIAYESVGTERALLLARNCHRAQGEMEDQTVSYIGHFNTARVCRRLGMRRHGLGHCQFALRASVRLQSPQLEAAALGTLGLLYMAADEAIKARACLNRYLLLSQRSGDVCAQEMALRQLGMLCMAHNQPEDGSRFLECALSLCEGIEARWGPSARWEVDPLPVVRVESQARPWDGGAPSSRGPAQVRQGAAGRPHTVSEIGASRPSMNSSGAISARFVTSASSGSGRRPGGSARRRPTTSHEVSRSKQALRVKLGIARARIGMHDAMSAVAARMMRESGGIDTRIGGSSGADKDAGIQWQREDPAGLMASPLSTSQPR